MMLQGLEKYGIGKWREISENLLPKYDDQVRLCHNDFGPAVMPLRAALQKHSFPWGGKRSQTAVSPSSLVHGL